MEFRIERRESFQIIGLLGYGEAECKEWDTLTSLWFGFIDKVNLCLWNGEGEENYYTALFWQVVAYWFQSDGEKTKDMIGAEYKG